MAQFKAFCEAAVKRLELERASMISAVAIGAQGTGKSIEETIDKIVAKNK